MRAEAEGFLIRVREVPDDDGPRLIFADWLDDQGDPRGEFIRVQIALSRMPDLDRRRQELLRVERELLVQFGETWAATLKGLATGPVFRRGFIEEVKVAARQFLAHGPVLFTAGPVRHLHLLDLGGHLGPVFASPLLARLTGLTVYGQHLREPLARAVAECPHLAGLRTLHLGRNHLGDAGVERLAASPYLAALEDLDLGENDLGEAAAGALSASARMAGLRRLDLRVNAIGPAGAPAVAGSEHLGKLERLVLAGNRLGGSRLATLPGAGAVGRVGALDLASNGLTPDGLRAILAEPGGVRELDLSDNLDLGDAGAEVLAGAEGAADLKVLRLTATNLTDAGLEALAASENLSRLVVLDLSNNQIVDEGFRALLRSRHLRQLRRLETRGIGLTQRLRRELDTKYNRDPVPAW